jgi:hypothetical protein
MAYALHASVGGVSLLLLPPPLPHPPEEKAEKRAMEKNPVAMSPWKFISGF